jgi:hypothetical protein
LAAGVDCCATPAPEYAATASTTPHTAVLVDLIIIFTISPDKSSGACAIPRRPNFDLSHSELRQPPLYFRPSILLGCLLCGIIAYLSRLSKLNTSLSSQYRRNGGETGC